MKKIIFKLIKSVKARAIRTANASATTQAYREAKPTKNFTQLQRVLQQQTARQR